MSHLSWMVMEDGELKDIRVEISGHYIGVQTLKKTVTSAIKFKIPTLTFYVFSTENWRRPKKKLIFY